MFKEFLVQYGRTFSFPNEESINQPSFYTWGDQAYFNFMIDMLQSLEPRREEKDTILLNELDEVAEVIFFMNGTYEIGFEINRHQHMVLRYKDCNVIGAYGVTFKQRTIFVYKTYTEC